MGRNALFFLVLTNEESISPKPYQTWPDIYIQCVIKKYFPAFADM